MRAFLGTVLSVIAVGVLLIAYGLLTPRTSFATAYPEARPIVASERVGLIDERDAVPQAAMYNYAPRAAMAYPVSDVRALPHSDDYVTPRRVPSPQTATASAPRTTATVVERAPSRSWQKTAMVIGGSSAAAAGLGAIFGGKKGALIGAAIGGGAGTLYEVTQRR